jgi:hypothetical protein
VPAKQLARRQRAVAALGAHTAEVLDQLRDAEDELLAGEVDGTHTWDQSTHLARHTGLGHTIIPAGALDMGHTLCALGHTA